jgi:uncharacterized membrane protein YhaH (DUF805 family)
MRVPPPFRFEGRIDRIPYALWSLGVLFSQHALVLLLSPARFRELTADPVFWLMPLRSLASIAYASDMTLIAGFAYFLIVVWALAALAFRRAVDSGLNEWIAIGAMAPAVQTAAIPILCFAPRVEPPAPGPPTVTDERSIKAAGIEGVIVGAALTLAAVAIATLGFGVYGYGLFVLSPFVIGAATGYLANRKSDIGEPRTTRLVMVATALGSAALLISAIEGLICILMAAPLGLGAAWVGGMLGRSFALHYGQRSPTRTLPGLALLPLVFAVEALLPPSTTFDTLQTITVKAPADVVWRSIVRMDQIDEPLALPFRLGVAYPLRGEIVGEGVGALRRGEFSTGTAIERVTEWLPERKLAFVVETDIPAMRELSPYEHVHAPHAIGYFRTALTSFELVPRPDGHTDVIERTSHELRLDPVLYWLPMARWVVEANNARVLAHIRRDAERQHGS